jgi:hypothetical protein
VLHNVFGPPATPQPAAEETGPAGAHAAAPAGSRPDLELVRVLGGWILRRPGGGRLYITNAEAHDLVLGLRDETTA